MKVDFYRHPLAPADAEAVAAVLAAPFLTTGQVAKAVEAQLGVYFSAPHAVLVNSWTNGAVAALLAMDIGADDEVIVPAMTFIASANVVELVGAKVVFADVDPATLLLTPELAARHVTQRTRAVIPVHLYGQMCDVPGLRDMLDRHPAASKRIHIIEDSAHCFEGERDGVKPGTVADVAIFSFYATKNVTCGEGGAIVTRDADLYGRILETRLHGMSAIAVDRFAAGRYNHWDMKRLGTKANLPDLLAALLPRQIATVDERLARRHAIADRYRRAFANGPLRLVAQLQACKSAEHIFPIGVANGARDAAIAALNAAGIGVTVNYRSVPENTFYKGRYPRASAACRAAHRWGEETLTLPLFVDLTREEQNYVIEMIHDRVYPLARPTKHTLQTE
jgi:UDP-4-amino-4-deoxy-L-arabinose-oxoglutarate aminotransferase